MTYRPSKTTTATPTSKLLSTTIKMAPSMHTNYPDVGKTPKPSDARPKITRVIFHSIVAALMFNGYYGLESDPAIAKWMDGQVGGHYQFLTINGLWAAIITMVLAAFSDMLPQIQLFKTIKRSVGLIALPLAVIISSIYWTLLLGFPHLIVPPAPAEPGEPSSTDAAPKFMLIPVWMDVSLHLLPALALAFDFFALEMKKYSAPASTWGATALAGLTAVVYGAWVEYCAKLNGQFPYPFLTVAPFAGRVAIYAGATGLALLAFRALNALHR